jgi:hypothetical protein
LTRLKKTYGIFRNKVYKLDVYSNQQLELNSNNQNDKINGFTEYIDVLGNKHNDILVKSVNIDELELAYDIQINAVFKGEEFETYAMGRFSLEQNEISLFMHGEDVEKYGFHKMEQFVFKKEVSLDDIEALVEIKKPILKFKGIVEERNIIPKNEIAEYIKNLD